jgi:two-component system cell cycle response regulator
MRLVDPILYVNLKASGRLPSPKGLALSIVRLLQRDDYKIDDLVRLIQSDPAITGELLRFSNAATYGHTRPIIALSEAVTILGILRVRILVLAFSVLHDHRSGNCPQFNYEQFWARALAAAISAQALASYAKINAEENFTAGLLCSLGELAMASIFPDRYGEIIFLTGDDIHKRIALEREIFGTDHCELNASLLLEWGLPEALVTAIYHCEIPDDAGFQEGSRIYGLTLSLHVALAMASICVAEDMARWTMLPNLYAKAARLGISTEEINSMADRIAANWLEWGELLKIQTREIPSFAELLTSSQPREQISTSSTCPWPNNKSLLLICTETSESSAIADHLKMSGYAVEYVSNSTDALVVALKDKPDLIIIEMSAPEIDGAVFCKALRDNSHGQSIYVIFVANHEEVVPLMQVLDMGADDILLRPITTLSLLSKLRGAFRIIQLQKELIKERNDMVKSAGEWAGANRRLTHVAMTDPLTQLSNRRHGLDTFSSEWAFAKSNNLPLSCLMLDIDHFKNINDQHGHKAGDAVLVILAILLQADARTDDLVFRYGGEEFCIICPGANLEMARTVAERIRQDVEGQPFQIGDIDISVTVSIGVATMMPIHANKEALIHDADTALYRAKETGRNKVC